MAVQGTWGIGGFKLPDVGFTEWMSGGQGGSLINNPKVYQAANTTQQNYANTLAQNKQYAQYQAGTNYNPYGPTVTSVNTYSPKYDQTGGSPNPSGGGNPGGDQGGGQPSGPSREDIMRGNINSAFDSYESYLDSTLNWLPGQQTQQEGLVNDAYGNMYGNLQSTYDTNNQKITGYQEDAKTRGRQSTSDLMENLRNMLTVGRQQIGAVGAGRSSATDALKYGYGKIAAKEGSNIYRGVNTDLSNLDQKRLDLTTTFNTEKTNLDQWKVSNLNAIKDKYMPYIMQLRNMKATAPMDRANSLNQLETGIVDRAMAEIRQIESTANNLTGQLSDWAKTRLQQLTGTTQNMGTNSNYQINNYEWNRMPGLNNQPSSPMDTNYYVSNYMKKKQLNQF